MGTEYHVQLKEYGTYEEDTFYGRIKRFGDITVEIYQGPNQGNNLSIKYKDEESKQIGSPDYVYIHRKRCA
ncbi:hypothetical protein IZY60_14145 [Lutibacter sp. B2]|nr:hypothetical protein [Lutibacter sp. B2]